MYGPTPPRPKKTNITRSRNGCIPCRSKKRKCDEGSPSCGLCSRLRITCSYQRFLVRFQDTRNKPERTRKAHGNGELVTSLTRMGNPLRALKDQAPSNRGMQPEYHISGSEQIFSNQYLAHVVDLLPVSVRPVVCRLSNLPALCNATVAFSAARFAYSLGTPYHTQSKTLIRPNRHFFIQSLNYFSRAIRLIQRNSSQLEDVFATIIFFILFENVVGTVSSYYCHLQGLETLTLCYHHTLSATPNGQLLLRASFFTLAKGALFLGPLHSLRRGDVVHRELDTLAERLCSRQEILFFMVVDVVRISSSLLLGEFIRCPSDNLQRVLQKMCGYGNPNLLVSSALEACEKLTSLRRRIDILFAQSAPLYSAFSQCTSHPAFHEMEFSFTHDNIPPITFASHEEAMACAMYALVQIYCDIQLLQSLLDGSTGPVNSVLNGWAKIILGIAKGYDPPRYLYEEMYNMNMCWILGLLCLRWPNPDILTYLAHTVLPHLKSTTPAVEDTAGALLLFEVIIEMLCSQNARGRKVFAVHVVHEDPVDSNAFLLVNRSLHFAIHGYGDDGSFFSDYIPALH
ncbi:hypothetical protein BDQ94DRAFT_186047 [Aspergillus welwitschiae]|uniref:Zn(2)-C6 fungal-type domain-containing protein n=1 Tax=Aspergillus welwitschiae TaxID=1341132 RepID=A0A3F3QA92_9EURO|nr:hypothetical protein BDQ94DRAFT_186047 [Aspergillus welwitschiae]RDH36035.1 hypothetical protein BDQ94DRAFT_186047 [Aspergillus welwitschiae]